MLFCFSLFRLTGCFILPLILAIPVLAQGSPAPYGPVPSERQLRWHEMEMYCLVHFGLNTYQDREWGYGDADPALFNPVKFDAVQIVRAASAAGLKGLILVAKHHDGFCLWPTLTTPYNISQSGWRAGKGDMVAEFANACRSVGLRFGLYCSPWDRNNANYGSPAYLDVYRAQLRELYSRYGELFISWHDGANGGDGFYGGAREKRTIDRTTYYDWDNTWTITRGMQPGAVIFSDIGLDVRWVGNEKGFAGETHWATFTPTSPDGQGKAAPGFANDFASPAGLRDGRMWMPAECDVPLRPGWFYHANQDDKVKSLTQLKEIYFRSVGRGADLDLGLAPDQRGLLHENDVRALREFGEWQVKTFGVNLASGAVPLASNARRGRAYSPVNLLDADRYSYWCPEEGVTVADVSFSLRKTSAFNLIRLRENIKLGQRIDGFAVDVWQDGRWAEAATGTSIGSCRLIRLPSVVVSKKIRVRITKAPVSPALSEVSLFLDR